MPIYILIFISAPNLINPALEDQVQLNKQANRRSFCKSSLTDAVVQMLRHAYIQYQKQQCYRSLVKETSLSPNRITLPTPPQGMSVNDYGKGALVTIHTLKKHKKIKAEIIRF